jgi:ligand-binding sensor domain-containing protein
MRVGGDLLADGPSGLWRREPTGQWRLVRPRAPGSLPRAHVNALAAQGATLWAGFFDGGVARSDAKTPRWESVEGTPWGVNALLPAGGAVYAATLRGAYRLERGRAVELPGAGGAFALASTGSGIAVGYGQGVLLPEQRLLSAFHGLPGNQAYALAVAPHREALWVGTPSGLGRIERRRVVFRATSGEGKLPHPWVTALLDREDALYVATYGGGVARRLDGAGERWERFVETEGLKVNAGALVADPSGRLWIGTQGKGLWRSDRALARFSRVEVPLPSPDVFSLAVVPSEGALFAGTAEGLARIPLETETP